MMFDLNHSFLQASIPFLEVNMFFVFEVLKKDRYISNKCYLFITFHIKYLDKKLCLSRKNKIFDKNVYLQNFMIKLF